MLHSILFISAGASAGAVSRWLLGRAFNALCPAIPMGTLAANLIGGYGKACGAPHGLANEQHKPGKQGQQHERFNLTGHICSLLLLQNISYVAVVIGSL